jgi:hypothetical protein
MTRATLIFLLFVVVQGSDAQEISADSIKQIVNQNKNDEAQ